MLYVWCDVFYGYVFYFKFRYINRYKEKKRNIFLFIRIIDKKLIIV